MLVSAAAGCAQPLVEDTFTPEQWAKLRADFAVPPLDACPPGHPQCAALAVLGQELFFEPGLSGPLLVDDPNGLGHAGDPGKVSCSSCHDPDHYYIDTRSQPNTVSLGAQFTKHNALTLVDIAIKETITHDSGTPVFTWIGAFGYASDVFEKLALAKAMNGSAATVGTAVRKGHVAHYRDAFGEDPQDDATVLANVEIAFDAYERRLVSVDSPFDRFLAGDDGALTPAQRHGFQLFAGTAACIECHHGPALTDLDFHVTGVAQRGSNVVPSDDGRFSTTKDPADEGRFLTASLRNVAMTGPYMHAGQLATLDDVVAFYRRGGDASGFTGERDPRITPLDDLTDQDALDLVAFLTALTGTPPDPLLGMPVAPARSPDAQD